MAPLLAVREAQERIVGTFAPKPAVTRQLEQAYRQVLAAPVLAAHDLPPFDNSSMDGFAVCSQDLAAASSENPRRLPVIQDIPAGNLPQRANPAGVASRIMTGAALPEGADAIVPVEDVHVEDDGHQAVFSHPVPAGQYVRPRGQDLRAGQAALPTGKRLTPQDVALIASLGYAQIAIYPPPRVALFSSGDELLRPGEPPQLGKIYDANQYLLRGLLEAAGAEVIVLGTARDDPADIRAHLQAACQAQADLILTSAGVSVGAYDYVRQELEANGNLTFWRVNMRPGKPVAFGDYRGVPFLGLPGNPVSAFVGCQVFTLPVIRRLRGEPPFQRHTVSAELLEPAESDGRESYLRCQLQQQAGRYTVRLTGHQGSGNLTALTRANALLILPSGVKSLPAGAMATVWTLDNGDEN